MNDSICDNRLTILDNIYAKISSIVTKNFSLDSVLCFG